MKKLRLFDSLKLVLATVACMFILNVAHAATTTINSVIAYGKTEQSGTPTPTAPVPIMTNNGVLKVSPNLFDSSLFDTTAAGLVYHSFSIPNGTYTMSTNFPAVSSGTTNVFIFAGRVSSGASSPNNGVSANVPRTITVTDGYYTVAYRSGLSGAGNANNPKDFDWMLEKGSTATTYEPYGTVIADGLTETIRDAAGHTATARMLLGLNDEYRDEQNINTGVITRKVGVKVLDGSESWELYNWSAGNVRDVMRVTLSSIAPDAKNVGVSLCSHFVRNNVGQFNGNTSAYAWASIYFDRTPRVAFRVAGITTVEQFKSWLAEQYANGTPVIIVYPLATETTENVTTQSLTTAPVRQTAGSILGMPIEVVFGDGVSEIITIATTRYNEEQFEPVQNRLSDAMDAVDDVVTRTMTQAQAIDTIATTKQTRPDEGCMAKYCLLVEDEDGTPHWYPIAGANGVAHNLPVGYTELQYIESTGTQYIDTGHTMTSDVVEYGVKIYGQPSGASSLFGSQTGSSPFYTGVPYTYAAGSGYAGQTLVFVGSSTNVISTIFPQNQWNTYTLQTTSATAASVTLNGTTTAFSYAGGIQKSRPVWLFGNNNVGSSKQLLTAKVASFYIKDNGVLVRNLVPARRNSDNVIGMYDLMDSNPATAFHTNAGTGTFTAGPDM